MTFPTGFIYDVAGTSIFADNYSVRNELLAFTNSMAAFEMLTDMAPTLNFEVGQVAKLPTVTGAYSTLADEIPDLVLNSRNDWDSFETSWDFTENVLVAAVRSTITVEADTL